MSVLVTFAVETLLTVTSRLFLNLGFRPNISMLNAVLFIDRLNRSVVISLPLYSQVMSL